MNPQALEGYRCASRYSPEQARFNGLRQRLQNAAARGDKFVWVNGECLTHEEFQFMMDCLREPKGKRP